MKYNGIIGDAHVSGVDKHRTVKPPLVQLNESLPDWDGYCSNDMSQRTKREIDSAMDATNTSKNNVSF